MVKFKNNKCQIYDKNKGQIITTFEMVPNNIFLLKMHFEEKLVLTLINDESAFMIWASKFEQSKTIK